jgi:hypothetical protein
VILGVSNETIQFMFKSHSPTIELLKKKLLYLVETQVAFAPHLKKGKLDFLRQKKKKKGKLAGIYV